MFFGGGREHGCFFSGIVEFRPREGPLAREKGGVIPPGQRSLSAARLSHRKPPKSWRKAHIVDALDTTDRFPALFAACHTCCLQVAQEFHSGEGPEEPWRCVQSQG